MLQRPVTLAFGLVVALLLAGTFVFATVRSDGERERERSGQAESRSALAAAPGG